MTKSFEEKAQANATKFVENLEWHDTLDVQNAVKKAFMEGVKFAIENNKKHAAKKGKN